MNSLDLQAVFSITRLLWQKHELHNDTTSQEENFRKESAL